MPETFVADITFGNWAYGTATETNTGVKRKTIQAVGSGFSLQSSTGTPYSVTRIVLSSAGTPYAVPSTVLSSGGTSYTVI